MTNYPSVIPGEITVCIGSNADDADAQIRGAIGFMRELSKDGAILSSPIYHCENSPYGNAVVRLSPRLSIPELIEKAKAYERRCGRTPEAKERGEVIIDIDIVMADGEVLREDYFAPYFAQGLRLLDKES